eukprot:snap_masked-scaffold_10-processed-gene-12.40-mRNA-1 protein AED:1.00 eAED:1.00 QI:0/0/0/0/1/1/2/0/281
METHLSAPTKEEVDLQQRNQSETNNSWISYRGSTPEEMVEVVNKVSANRFRVKKQSSHSFCEEETKRIFGSSKKMVQHTEHEVQVKKNERKFQPNLKPAELRMLKYIGVADTHLTSVEVALHREFPGIYFDKVLLKRQLKRAREEGRDSEDNNIQILIKTGKRCLSNGGNFELYYSNDTEGRPRLKGLTFQEQLQVKRKNIYSESIQIDTTHGLSRYIFVVMFPVGVDCFMKAVNFGCTLMQTENHEQVIRGLKDLGLEHTEVMMRDGSLALAKAAKLLGA